MKFPTTEAEWRSIARVFEAHCNIPNCIGAVDGKHVNILPPPNSGAYYYNYKGYNSLVLMAICDANCEFIMCDWWCEWTNIRWRSYCIHSVLQKT
ncbi:unnamed protein product [Acanthoscelides obtectus]|uniref:DDE Tnp4 domain-containing protein n=1 Tax=Acanthoscelides obtectus TaxID=200917 RepID=A0A9P0LW93_ACAOB|nr:unnamed protein product [Acanthoscelides obtectus]CAK1687722.1 hypothetical protein AOBTE_LOCUS36336 [Acanthoscelides obtectus]